MGAEILLSLDLQAGGIPGDQESLGFPVEIGQNDDVLAAVEPGNLAFDAFEAVAPRFLLCGGLGAVHIGIKTGFDSGEGPWDEIGPRECGQNPRFLLVASQASHRDREQGWGENAQSGGEVTPGQFFGDEATENRAGLAATAVCFGHAVGDQAEFVCSPENLRRQRAVFIGIAGAGPDFVLRELMNGLDDERLFLAGFEVNHFWRLSKLFSSGMRILSGGCEGRWRVCLKARPPPWEAGFRRRGLGPCTRDARGCEGPASMGG